MFVSRLSVQLLLLWLLAWQSAATACGGGGITTFLRQVQITPRELIDDGVVVVEEGGEDSNRRGLWGVERLCLLLFSALLLVLFVIFILPFACTCGGSSSDSGQSIIPFFCFAPKSCKSPIPTHALPGGGMWGVVKVCIPKME